MSIVTVIKMQRDMGTSYLALRAIFFNEKVFVSLGRSFNSVIKIVILFNVVLDNRLQKIIVIASSL